MIGFATASAIFNFKNRQVTDRQGLTVSFDNFRSSCADLRFSAYTFIIDESTQNLEFGFLLSDIASAIAASDQPLRIELAGDLMCLIKPDELAHMTDLISRLLPGKRTVFVFQQPRQQRYMDFFDLHGSENGYWSCVRHILESNDGFSIILYCRLNIFSILGLQTSLAIILELNRKFKNPLRDPALYIHILEQVDISWQRLSIARDFFQIHFNDLRKFLEINQWSKHPDNVGFHAENLEQLDQTISQMVESDTELVRWLQAEFAREIVAVELRMQRPFLAVYPEIQNFWKHAVEWNSDGAVKDLQKTKGFLDVVSPSFCLAKWTTATLHLDHGTTHSCHHPAPHKIPLSELNGNAGALHNTAFKIEQRRLMIQGQRPNECEYCWNIEDLQTGEVSDRVIKSAVAYSLAQYENIVHKPLAKKVSPSYLEVSLSNKCQFKCSYCSSDYSSTWAEEISKFGEYKTGSGSRTKEILAEEDNPYVTAFWNWWPELKKDLNTLRITGGEPLLSPGTFRLMEGLIAEPQPDLTLSINSNLGAPKVLIEKFISTVVEMEKSTSVKKLEVYTSIDTYGSRAEYIRYGLNNDYFWSNVENLLAQTTDLRVYIMCTFNALSVTSFIPLLVKFREINIKYRNEKRSFPLDIDFPYLRYPEYQSVKILPPHYQKFVLEIIEHMENNAWLKTAERVGFLDYHIIKIKRILEWMRQPWPEEKTNLQKARFYDFFSEHDRRRTVSFENTFPEMSDFWNECREQSRQMSKEPC